MPDYILEKFNLIGQVTVERHKTIVSIVGEKMKRNPEITGQILAILRKENIHIDLISQFASQISFMFIIDDRDIERTITLLHRHYIEGVEISN